MNVNYKKPTDKLSEYVQDILVIENYHVTVPFCLPLFANGTPTLLFHTVQGQYKNNSGYLTLFGQTILPDKLQIKDNFTLIAYFLKPYSLISLFGISAQELLPSSTLWDSLRLSDSLCRDRSTSPAQHSAAV